MTGEKVPLISTSYRRGALPRANMAIGVLLTSGGGTFRSSMPVA